MAVAVIGGGVVGMSTAWSLRRRGEDVTVIERGSLGQSASGVNAGWITPSLSTPLASPGVVGLGLKHAFDPNGALSIRPRLDTDWIRWLWKFARASRPWAYESGVRALLQLNSHTLELFDELRDDGVDFEMHAAGLLALAQSSDGLEWFTQLFDQLLPMGFPGRVEYLSGDEARRRDAAVGPGVQVAAHTSIDRHINPESLLRGLLERVSEMGVSVLQRTAVEAVTRVGARWSIRMPDHSLDVDHVVIALGAATNALLTPLGIQLPIIGAKGCSNRHPGSRYVPTPCAVPDGTQAGTEPIPRRDTHRRRVRITCPRRTGPRAADPTPRGTRYTRTWQDGPPTRMSTFVPAEPDYDPPHPTACRSSARFPVTAASTSPPATACWVSPWHLPQLKGSPTWSPAVASRNRCFRSSWQDASDDRIRCTAVRCGR